LKRKSSNYSKDESIEDNREHDEAKPGEELKVALHDKAAQVYKSFAINIFNEY
jgi:hypothetical protein